MKYQIDQSGKIEHTSQVTVVAVANGKTKSIQIGAGEKQKLIKAMRKLDFPKKTFVFNREKKPDLKAETKEILQVIYSTKKVLEISLKAR